ncbi:hypothetical protein TorRG33x02_156100 [Trema orientale]|uniref:Uncharacterized protein n=1 Tax=Trema orientale TaxID=63057 RepID=A0A2P5EST7_TREOI|nr:hypothetical protein TorRG33x02_156100 [Trema orientale]
MSYTNPSLDLTVKVVFVTYFLIVDAHEQFFLTNTYPRPPAPSTVTSPGKTSNMLWITARVWFSFGLKAKKEAQSRVVSVQFMGVGYENRERAWSKRRRRMHVRIPNGVDPRFMV